MDNLFRIIITSGLLGILISTIANLIISIKTLRSQRKLESDKAYYSFLKEKLDLLKNARSSIKYARDFTPLYEALRNPVKNAEEFLVEAKTEYLHDVDTYKAIRCCFSNNDREKLDKLIKNIESLELKRLNCILANWDREKTKEKVPPGIIQPPLKQEFELIKKFEKALDEAIDKELISTANRLSKPL